MIFRKSLCRKNAVNHFQLERRGLGKRRARSVWVPPNQGNYEINIFWYSFIESWIIIIYLKIARRVPYEWVPRNQGISADFSISAKLIHFGSRKSLPPREDNSCMNLLFWFLISNFTFFCDCIYYSLGKAVKTIGQFDLLCPFGQKLVETEGWAH